MQNFLKIFFDPEFWDNYYVGNGRDRSLQFFISTVPCIFISNVGNGRDRSLHFQDVATVPYIFMSTVPFLPSGRVGLYVINDAIQLPIIPDYMVVKRFLPFECYISM